MELERFAILQSFCEAVAWAEDSNVVYQRIADTAVKCFGCDNVSLHLIDSNTMEYIVRAATSGNIPGAYQPSTLSVDTGRMRLIFESQDLIIMDYTNPNDQDVIPPEAILEGYKSAVSIPLYTEAGSIGMLSLTYKRPLPFDDDDLVFLKSLGRALGPLVNRILMSKKDLQLQILRERKRLSNEIHDNIAQLVSAIGIKADTAIECREEGDMEALDEELDNLAEMTRKVTKMLRAEMLALRAPLDEEDDIAESIRDLVFDFRDRWGIQVEVKDECDGRIITSEYAKLQLVRIVNESLQNVLRHSQADSVAVTITGKDKDFKVAIRDNGIGFKMSDVAPERLGLRIMKERALSAGGSLTIRSDSTGTEVIVSVPAMIARG